MTTRSRLSKRNVSIAIIALTFVGMVVYSVGYQSPSALFVVLLAAFSILVIALSPWVLGE